MTGPSRTGGQVRVVLAGGPMLVVDGEVVAARGPTRQRSALVLAYLLLERRRRVPADELANAAWGDELPASWPASLRRLVSDARAWLDGAGLGDALGSATQSYWISLPTGAVLDLDEAHALLDRAMVDHEDVEASTGAAALLDAPLLPGLDAPWLATHRRQADELRLTALEAASDALRRDGRHEDAIAAARQVIEAEPLRESAYRLAMAAHREAGRVGLALRLYEECRQRLAEDVGSSPSPITVAAYQALLVPFVGEPEREPGPPESTQGPLSFAGLALSIEAVASRTAVGNLEGRLAALENDPHPDPLARVEVLIELGQARWALSGATDQLRRISLAAGEAALSLGSPSHFGAVTALASTTTGVGERDADTEDLLERALVVFSADRAARARILSLQSELRTGEESVALASEAVALARKEGDGGLLLDTLLVLDQSLAWSPDLTARLAIVEECEALLDQSPRWRTRPTFEPLTRLQAGDFAWFRGETARLTTLSAMSTQWEPRFYSTAFRAVVAHLAGDLATGFQLADQLMAQSRDELNAAHSAAGLYLALSRDSGGIAQLLPVIEDMTESRDRISAFHAAAALGRALTGDRTGAITLIDRMLMNDGDDLPRDHIWQLSLGLLAEAVALTEHAPAVATLDALLEPFAGQLCAGAHATVCLGSMDGYRGMLSITAGDLDAAVERFSAALAFERSLPAPLLEARTSAWAAAAHIRRGHATEAARLAGRAQALAVPAGTANAVHLVLQAHGLADPTGLVPPG